ncbi:hypothetical protein [Picosynechococcus sp. PCC 73109]|uniref:hypothetical protein n=1 Tax=Picosynechococcus sp. PCC 73109 TaxID=374982 RepID=UPI0007458529|nr:hypothetical protein [Picosynechococcus sp. PCC 73109]AMA10804.1 hypothetical protein AWQ23_15310 [Picosynechococcus sp. PCC 73109]
MKSLNFILTLLLLLSTISCGESSRQEQNPNAITSQTEPAPAVDPNASTPTPLIESNSEDGSTPIENSSTSISQTNPRNLGSQLFLILISIFAFVLAFGVLIVAFMGHEELKLLIEKENQKNHTLYKNLSKEINDLKDNLLNLDLRNQSLESKVKQHEKQITLSNSHNLSQSSITSEDDSKNHNKEETFSEIIAAFLTKDESFFKEKELILLIPKPQEKNTQKTEFIQIKELPKAIFIAIQINQDYLLVPNFMLSRYDQLETVYTGTKVFNNNNYEKDLVIKQSGTAIFKVYGYGEDLTLKEPAKVQKTDDNTWQLEEAGVYVGEDADIEILTEAFNEQDNTFFQKQIMFPVAISQESLQTQTNRNHKIQFQQVENHRDAEFIVLKIELCYFLIPDFLSPYYSQLNWLTMSEEIFQYSGQGDLVTLIKPAEVKEKKDGIWTLVKSGNCNLIKST